MSRGFCCFLQFGLALVRCRPGGMRGQALFCNSAICNRKSAVIRTKRSNTATPSRGRPYSNAPRIPPGLLGTHAFVIGLVGLVFVDGLWLVDIVE